MNSKSLGIFAAVLVLGALASQLNCGAACARIFGPKLVRMALTPEEVAEYADASVTREEIKAQMEAMGMGPAYLENIEDVTCLDAGTEFTTSGGQILSISCECSAATLFGHETVIPLTGRAETNFDGNVRSGFKCRSQAATTCDCWALVTSNPG